MSSLPSGDLRAPSSVKRRRNVKDVEDGTRPSKYPVHRVFSGTEFRKLVEELTGELPDSNGRSNNKDRRRKQAMVAIEDEAVAGRALRAGAGLATDITRNPIVECAALMNRMVNNNSTSPTHADGGGMVRQGARASESPFSAELATHGRLAAASMPVKASAQSDDILDSWAVGALRGGNQEAEPRWAPPGQGSAVGSREGPVPGEEGGSGGVLEAKEMLQRVGVEHNDSGGMNPPRDKPWDEGSAKTRIQRLAPPPLQSQLSKDTSTLRTFLGNASVVEAAVRKPSELSLLGSRDLISPFPFPMTPFTISSPMVGRSPNPFSQPLPSLSLMSPGDPWAQVLGWGVRANEALSLGRGESAGWKQDQAPSSSKVAAPTSSEGH